MKIEISEGLYAAILTEIKHSAAFSYENEEWGEVAAAKKVKRDLKQAWELAEKVQANIKELDSCCDRNFMMGSCDCKETK